MLKEFWEKKKYLIQLVGILTGIGAFFLSITPPENVEARQALANIQFFWLIIITLGCITLVISFYNFSTDLEKHLGLKWGVNLKGTLSVFILLSLVFLLLNLWIYIFKLYTASFWNFIETVNYGISSVLIGVFVYFLSIIKIIKNSYIRFFSIIISFIVVSVVSSLLALLIIYKGMVFPFWQFLLASVVLFVFLLVIIIYKNMYSKKD
jgi:hypothetical protein